MQCDPKLELQSVLVRRARIHQRVPGGIRWNAGLIIDIHRNLDCRQCSWRDRNPFLLVLSSNNAACQGVLNQGVCLDPERDVISTGIKSSLDPPAAFKGKVSLLIRDLGRSR